MACHMQQMKNYNISHERNVINQYFPCLWNTTTIVKICGEKIIPILITTSIENNLCFERDSHNDSSTAQDSLKNASTSNECSCNSCLILDCLLNGQEEDDDNGNNYIGYCHLVMKSYGLNHLYSKSGSID